MPTYRDEGVVLRTHQLGEADRIVTLLTREHGKVRAVAKGVRVPAGVPHLNICCSPVRYAWDLQEQYLEESGLSRGVKGVAARALLKYIRDWDRRTATRQTQILRLIALGQSSKEIARDLDLSIKTVETHRAQIMDRLDIRDLAGLVRYAVRTGLVDAER